MPKSSEWTPRLTAVLVTHEASGVDDTGIVGPYLESLGHRVVRHQVFATIETKDPDIGFPSVEGVDLVVVFGSTAHAWEEEHAPWVEQEVEWVRQVIDRGISFVGICFGGQLLATALGGSVRPVRDHEVGMLTFPTEHEDPVVGREPLGDLGGVSRAGQDGDGVSTGLVDRVEQGPSVGQCAEAQRRGRHAEPAGQCDERARTQLGLLLGRDGSYQDP